MRFYNWNLKKNDFGFFDFFHIFFQFFSYFFRIFSAIFLKKNDVKIDQKMSQKSIQNHDFREKICKEMLQMPPDRVRRRHYGVFKRSGTWSGLKGVNFVITKESLKLRKIIT